MTRKQLLIATAALLFMTLPAMAQPRGGGRPPAVRYGGGNFNNFSRGPGTNFGFGVTLGTPRPGGLSFGYGTGGFGNYGGNGYGGAYRPYYGYNNGFYAPGLVIPQTYIVPRTYLVPQTYVVPNTALAPVPTVAPAEPAVPSELGLLITELKAQGSAKVAGLRQGDVILSVDGKRIQNYEELRAALTTAGKKQASVEFIDGSNGQIEKKDVGVVDGKMGITIEEVPLKRGE